METIKVETKIQGGRIEKEKARNREKRERKRRRNKDKNKDRQQPAFQNKRDEELEKQGGEGKKVEIEYVPEKVDLKEFEEFKEFEEIFKRFESRANGGLDEENERIGDDKQVESQERPKGMDDVDMGENEKQKEEKEEEEEEEEEEYGDDVDSNNRRKRNKDTVAELKRRVRVPDMVEFEDVTGPDPQLLVELKAYRNTVPVPKHWSIKRKYLQYKRGVEKRPFELPKYILDTGIAEMRQVVEEKEEGKTMKSKMREKMKPRMNKLVLDYQRLHDAFFKFQTVPDNLSGFGDMFYEGREFESAGAQAAKSGAFEPGVISEELKAALGMPNLAPPPYLLNMQRFGLPPSYPEMLIPGLSAPIPRGAQWGYHPGGWGRPPVDEFGRALYGRNVLESVEAGDEGENEEEFGVGRIEHWGEVIEEDEEEEEEEEEDEDEEEEEEGEGEEDEVMGEEGKETPGGISSVASTIVPGKGTETPQTIELRKEVVVGVERPKTLYTVLQQKQVNVEASSRMGSEYVYSMDTTTTTNNVNVNNNINEEEEEESLKENEKNKPNINSNINSNSNSNKATERKKKEYKF